MRGYHWILITIAAIAVLVIFMYGPRRYGEEPVLQDIGLLLVIGALFLWISDLYMRKKSPGADWPGFRTTIGHPDPIGFIEVAVKDQPPMMFEAYKLGGNRYAPDQSGGKSNGYLIVRQDLVYRDKGDVVNVHFRTLPDLFRINPDPTQWERPLDQLPDEVKKFIEERGWAKVGYPIYYGRDPLPQVVIDADRKAAYKYKARVDMLEETVGKLRQVNKDHSGTMTNIAKTGRLSSETLKQQAKPKQSFANALLKKGEDGESD